MPRVDTLEDKVIFLRSALEKAQLEPLERTLCERYLDELQELCRKPPKQGGI
jgi:hypothetical protein